MTATELTRAITGKEFATRKKTKKRIKQKETRGVPATYASRRERVGSA